MFTGKNYTIPGGKQIMHQNYIEDCLKDGGCTEEEIKECLCNQNRILKMRAKQLDIVHKEQEKLACIDQFCHELKKEKKDGNHKK